MKQTLKDILAVTKIKQQENIVDILQYFSRNDS